MKSQSSQVLRVVKSVTGTKTRASTVKGVRTLRPGIAVAHCVQAAHTTCQSSALRPTKAELCNNNNNDSHELTWSSPCTQIQFYTLYTMCTCRTLKVSAHLAQGACIGPRAVFYHDHCVFKWSASSKLLHSSEQDTVLSR